MRNSNLAEVEAALSEINYQTQDDTDGYELEPSHGDDTEEYSSVDYRIADDESLVRLYLEEENEWVFNELVNRYSCKIYRLAFNIIRNEKDADDILQEVFLTLFEKLDTFKNESKFSTWLYSLARNTGLQYLKRNKKYRNHDHLIDDTYGEEAASFSLPAEDWRFIPDEIVIQERRREKIETALMEIPEIYRTVLRLKDVEGHSNREVGDMLGLSLTAVKSRALRARQKIKERLSEYSAGELY